MPLGPISCQWSELGKQKTKSGTAESLMGTRIFFSSFGSMIFVKAKAAAGSGQRESVHPVQRRGHATINESSWLRLDGMSQSSIVR